MPDAPSTAGSRRLVVQQQDEGPQNDRPLLLAEGNERDEGRDMSPSFLAPTPLRIAFAIAVSTGLNAVVPWLLARAVRAAAIEDNRTSATPGLVSIARRYLNRTTTSDARAA